MHSFVLLLVYIIYNYLDKKVYIGNVGDSRAIASKYGGKIVNELTQDHKPIREDEKNRIERNGGLVYQ